MKSFNTMKAKDMLVSLANKLPENLQIDAVNEEGKFTVEFLFRLSSEQLDYLNAEVNKFNSNDPLSFSDKMFDGFTNVFLSFSTKMLDSTECPKELKNFSCFDWDKVKNIKISGSTQPFLQNTGSDPQPYVSVVFELE